MRKYSPVFLIIILAFLLVSCGGQSTTDSESKYRIFESPTFGKIAVFPSYDYMGVSQDNEGKGLREYHLWESPYDGNYALIIQIIPKEGEFPSDLIWVTRQNALYVKGMRAAYESIASRTYSVMQNLGAEFPACFILAEEVHVSPREAIFRILITPDDMCTGDYESTMQELDRTLIIRR